MRIQILILWFEGLNVFPSMRSATQYCPRLALCRVHSINQYSNSRSNLKVVRVVRWLSAKFWRDLYRADNSTKLCMVVA